ncbi:MAG: dihydroorotate dehydrogenase (quinone) [Acidiferrobacterales bacterium]
MYRLLRPLLFLLDAEHSHDLVLSLLRLAYQLPGVAPLLRQTLVRRVPSLPVELMGLRFPNPVGLAAGLDKNAECVLPLNDLGFGWLELGTVTPLPQAGNPKKRLFRIPSHGALINRMGFNNVGIEAFVNNLKRGGKPGIIGVNIGKNKDTPNAQALEDYLRAFRAVYQYADYIVVNVSSPNTPGLRDLQEREKLDELLLMLKHEQVALGKSRRVYVPLAIKIAPDLEDNQITAIAQLAVERTLDAVIATNTTLTRPTMEGILFAKESGGLSGRPLKELSTAVIGKLYAHLQGRVPIIGVGGIESADDAWDKLVAGADLIQIYTAVIYQGPGVIARIVRGLADQVHNSGCATLAEAVAQARIKADVADPTQHS